MLAPFAYAAAQGTMQGMDHGQMQGMDHSQIKGMDHGQMQGMDHSQMQGMEDSMTGMAPHQKPALTQSRTPIPAVTAADRAAVYKSDAGHTVHDESINYMLLFDQLEWQDADDGSALNWEFTGWAGGDVDRLWIRSEGERVNGKTEEAEVQALWGHAIGPWWDVVAGVRQDFKPGDSRTWAAFGLQGMALYNFEAEATAFVGEGGHTALRLGGDYDIFLTNRLILQPTAEVNFYGKDDPQRGTGSGLAESEVGVRLRYEIRREFAPYIGVTWNRSYGNTADYARDEGEDRSEARLVLGVRMWF
ncbi:copper resistance protein B [Pseudomonas alliivorans]|uniref:Copper resistance protein B n=2 Tax=Pseudomonas cannabina TaxID=86840 RepID=A0ABS1X7W4_PSEC1|nr:copper resistance protein B [Pseudomonas cannabina]MEE4964492.1 copper resistance protein B [Pseudomonas alliivorans]MBM0137552.1 copper resistance protein B [Pseudomonas cannabina pv. alisalensis]MEE4974575.1 copper resistance protein B [Pseudomonas alliivorans]MEE4979724.1 copper resistance protein B [Pseudomonas alliivorans]MEE4984823.1 copper resistance protein B [Pseudomonas alliivorans]